MGITKALVVFDFTLNDAFEDVSVDDFSIVRYISVRAGDPGDYAILKPTAPFVKQKKRYEDRNRFSNPVRVRSAVMSPFVIPLGKYPIPSKVHQLARDESEAMETIDKMFRGESSHFDEKDGVDYSACLDADNYSQCMQHLLWLEETQMNGAEDCCVGIVQSVARPAPYLIYGPPGTGKTVTLCESILQTMFAKGSDPAASILVCAPSNTAVDVVVERLAPFVTPSEMLRIVAYSRDKGSVPALIMQYANFDEENDCFTTPAPAAIKEFRIVAVTIASGGKLPNQGVIDHFTHVFIDEAGHAVEADALGCLVSVTKQDETNPPAVILAGDPKQLGPIIRSDVCKKFGLEKSFLERLSQREAYARSDETDDLGNHYDRRMITKLVHNYRSHPTILDLPNRAFYDGDLIAEADITVSHRFVGWEHLPTRGFPIIFHGIEGEDTREQNSPSWFNPDEAQIVKMYVELLVKDTKQNKCKPEDIGIITPYHKQVQKIRMLLGAHGYSDVKVGSVEEFQGSERPVIIISTVRSTVDHIAFDEKHKLGFLSSEKRFNVAITRAQALLIMVGNPFTLEKDANWESMIHHAVDGGGYTGVEYTKKEQRVDSRAAIEDVISGLEATNLDDDSSDEGGDDFVVVSHVTAQEGPAWNLEE
ncbi:hypothetical protein ACHAXT_006714 [Thalassiosira profunda]